MNSPYGLTMMVKMALETNVPDYEKIMYEAKILNELKNANAVNNRHRGWLGFLNAIISNLSAYRDKVLDSAQQDYSLDIDCQHASTPC